MTKLAVDEIARLDPYRFMATIGKRVEDNSFDVAIAEAVAMFVDRSRAASELARVATHDGRVLATEFFWRQPPTAEAREIFLGQVCPGLEFDAVEAWVRIYESAGLTDLERSPGSSR
jgi:hypothetical protein